MKPLTRVTLLLLLFLFASTAVFADTILVGELFLDPQLAGSLDQFDLVNATGSGAPSNGTTTPLTFSGMVLTVGTAAGTVVNTIPGTVTAATLDTILNNLVFDSITSFTLTGNVSPTTVSYGGGTDTISGTFTVSWSGGALDTGTGCPTGATGSTWGSSSPCEFDIDVTGTPVSTVPEPATLTLYGSGLCFVAWLRRRRSLKA